MFDCEQAAFRSGMKLLPFVFRKKSTRTIKSISSYRETQIFQPTLFLLQQIFTFACKMDKARDRYHELVLIGLLSTALVISNANLVLRCLLYFLGTILLAFLLLLFSITRFPKARKIQAERAVAFRPELVPKELDTIVIGSGSGGSTCANLLAQSGQRVLVLEQHPDRTGGCTHSFREQGCEWDTGLHYTSKDMSCKTARPGAIMDFMSRGTQEWTPLKDPYDEILFPQDNMVKSDSPNYSSYPFVSGATPTVDGILDRVDPGNEVLRERALTYMKICQDINSGFTALGASRLLPSWLQFLVREKVQRLMKYASFTVRDVQHAVLTLGYSPGQLLSAEKLPKAPEGADPDPSIRRLKGILCHPIGDYAVQPREATMAAHGVTMAHYMDGGAYTVGATNGISIKNLSMVRNFGGEVLVDATVRSIIIEHGRAVGVRVSNTSDLEKCKDSEEEVPMVEIRAKNVVCATSIYNLYTKFLPQDLPIVKQFKDPERRTVRQSNGHVFLFCKIKGDATELKLPTHNLWYFNNYDLDSAFDEYWKTPTEVRPPTVYIGFPCTKDTTWKRRFPGISNCILISDGLYEWFEKWADKPSRNRGADYMRFKEQLTNHLLDILYESVPQVRDKVEFHHLGTPLSEVYYLASFRGGSYGTKCLPEMFAPINRQWTTTPHTSVKGLYLAGSDAFLPSGESLVFFLHVFFVFSQSFPLTFSTRF
jgi:all-trans-retinol 13,14-reductase